MGAEVTVGKQRKTPACLLKEDGSPEDLTKCNLLKHLFVTDF